MINEYKFMHLFLFFFFCFQKNGAMEFSGDFRIFAAGTENTDFIMKKYKAYLFDFDYTLADSSKGIVLCFRTVLERHDYTDVTDLQIKRTIGLTLEESFALLTGVADPDVLAAYKAEYVKAADLYMTANTILFPETLPVLRSLKEQGARIGIISTKFRYRIVDLLSRYQSENLLDVIIGGEDVRAHKPSPEGLLCAVERLRLAADDVLYLGDSVVDAQTARAAGVDFAGVLHGMTTREELEQYPHVALMETLDKLL